MGAAHHLQSLNHGSEWFISVKLMNLSWIRLEADQDQDRGGSLTVLHHITQFCPHQGLTDSLDSSSQRRSKGFAESFRVYSVQV